MRRRFRQPGVVRGVTPFLLALAVGACDALAPPSARMPGPGDSTEPATAPVGDGAAIPVLSWTEIVRPDDDPLWGAQGMLSDADGFLLYGGVGDQLMTWSSADGRSWSAAPLPGVTEGPSLAAATSDATVLVAITGTNRCAHPVGEWLWRRVAGQQEWAAVPFEPGLFCAGGIPQIAASNDAFVVAGTGTGEQPFSWRSVDGLHWFDVSNGLSFDAPPALLASTPDGFVEIGRGSITDIRILRNSGWTAMSAPPVPPAFNGELPGLEPAVALLTNAGLFAFFQREDPLKWSAWLRRPGGQWIEVGIAGLPLGFVQGGTTIRGQPYLFVFDGQLTHLVGSADQQTWTEVATPPLSQIGGVAVFDGRALLWGNKDPVGMGLGNTGLFLAELPAP
jgi:hypothetical protein